MRLVFEFVMRMVSRAKTALERQTKEAVRIRRRGGEGAILNSKAEFNRCYIPQLKLEEEELVEEMEQKEKEQEETVTRELDEIQKQWELGRREKKGAVRRRIAREQGGAQIRAQGKQKREQDGRKSKRRKYELVEKGWGEHDTGQLLNKRREQPQNTPVEPEMEPVETAISPTPLPLEEEELPYPKSHTPPPPPIPFPTEPAPKGTEEKPQKSPPKKPKNTLTEWLITGKQKEGDKNTPPPQKSDSNSEEKPVTNRVKECQFKRGVCTTHNCKADRVTLNEKKWGKISTGYGWVYRKKIKFICRAESEIPTVPTISTYCDVAEQKNCDVTGISAAQVNEKIKAGGLAM